MNNNPSLSSSPPSSIADELTQITLEVKELRARQQASSTRSFTTRKYTTASQPETTQPAPAYPPAIPAIPAIPPSPIITEDDDTPPMRFVLQPDPTPSRSTSTSHSASTSYTTPSSHSSSSPNTSPISFSRSRLGLPHSSSKAVLSALTDLQEKIRSLERERTYYQDSYEDLEKENQALTSDLKSQILTLEKEMWSLKGKMPSKRSTTTSTSYNNTTNAPPSNIHHTKPTSISSSTIQPTSSATFPSSNGKSTSRREAARTASASITIGHTTEDTERTHNEGLNRQSLYQSSTTRNRPNYTSHPRASHPPHTTPTTRTYISSQHSTTNSSSSANSHQKSSNFVQSHSSLHNSTQRSSSSSYPSRTETHANSSTHPHTSHENNNNITQQRDTVEGDTEKKEESRGYRGGRQAGINTSTSRHNTEDRGTQKGHSTRNQTQTANSKRRNRSISAPRTSTAPTPPSLTMRIPHDPPFLPSGKPFKTFSMPANIQRALAILALAQVPVRTAPRRASPREACTRPSCAASPPRTRPVSPSPYLDLSYSSGGENDRSSMEDDGRIGVLLDSLEREAQTMREELARTHNDELCERLTRKESQITLLREFHAHRTARPASPLKAPLINERHVQAINILHSLQDLHP